MLSPPRHAAARGPNVGEGMWAPCRCWQMGRSLKTGCDSAVISLEPCILLRGRLPVCRPPVCSSALPGVGVRAGRDMRPAHSGCGPGWIQSGSPLKTAVAGVALQNGIVLGSDVLCSACATRSASATCTCTGVGLWTREQSREGRVPAAASALSPVLVIVGRALLPILHRLWVEITQGNCRGYSKVSIRNL